MTDQLSATRRDFLKTSAGLAAGAAVAGTLLTPQGVYAQADETIKIALVGCGGRGTAACGQALSTKGPVKLIAVADAFQDQAHGSLQNLKNNHGDRVAVADDHVFIGLDAYKKAIDAGPDLVILATPPGFRPIHFAYAVEKNKNIFSEKPVATDAPGIRQFLKANDEAKQKNLKVGIGLQRHHQPPYLETMKRLHDGALGAMDMLRVYWNDAGVWVRTREEQKRRNPNLTEMEYQVRNWYYFVWTCGDHITEQHIHNLDVANWVKQDHPISAYGQGGRQVLTGPDRGQIYDHHYVEFTYKDGTKCISQCRHWPNTRADVSEHAHGINGYCDISQHRIELRNGQKWRYQGPTPDPYQVEHDDLFDAIRNNKKYNEGEYGAHSTMTSILGRMATYSGQEVRWDEAINSQLDLHPKEYSFDAEVPQYSKPDANGHYPYAKPGQPDSLPAF